MPEDKIWTKLVIFLILLLQSEGVKFIYLPVFKDNNVCFGLYKQVIYSVSL